MFYNEYHIEKLFADNAFNNTSETFEHGIFNLKRGYKITNQHKNPNGANCERQIKLGQGRKYKICKFQIDEISNT